MTDEQSVIYMRAQILACEIEMQAMIAENKRREQNGLSIAYGEESFRDLFKRYPISHNDVLSQFTQ